MFAHIVLVICVLTGAFAQAPIRTRHYTTVSANNNVFYGDRSHVSVQNHRMQPICKPLDRDLMIDILLYDRITINHNGVYPTAAGEVRGVGVEFQRLQEAQLDFTTILTLVFRNDEEFNRLLTI